MCVCLSVCLRSLDRRQPLQQLLSFGQEAFPFLVGVLVVVEGQGSVALGGALGGAYGSHGPWEEGLKDGGRSPGGRDIVVHFVSVLRGDLREITRPHPQPQ